MLFSSSLLLASSLLASAVSALPSPSLSMPSTKQMIPKQNMPKVLIDPSLYPTFVRYATFAAAAIPLTCATPPYGAVVQSYVSDEVSNVTGTIFRDDSTQEFIFGVAGTMGTEESASNLLYEQIPWISPGIDLTKCVDCGVHTGFLNDWNSIANQTIAVLAAGLDQYPGYTIVTVGHSLGAAITHLAYASFHGLGYNVSAGYSMGQPRVGNTAVANYLDALSGASEDVPGVFYRITHTFDNVPQLPPVNYSGGFTHSRTEYWELNTTDNTQSAGTTYRCYGQEPYDCNDSTTASNDAGGISFTGNSQHPYYTGLDFNLAESGYYCQ